MFWGMQIFMGKIGAFFFLSLIILSRELIDTQCRFPETGVGMLPGSKPMKLEARNKMEPGTIHCA